MFGLFNRCVEFVSDTINFGPSYAVDCAKFDAETSISDAAAYVKEHPVKSAIIAAATVTTGAVVVTNAGAIAAAIGKTGALGAASTGTEIGSLSGAALESASLAKLGGGAKIIGGFGEMGGKVVLTTSTSLASEMTTKKLVDSV